MVSERGGGAGESLNRRRGEGAVVEGGGDEEAGDRFPSQGLKVLVGADAAAGGDVEVRVSGGDLTAEVECSQAGLAADVLQVEDNEIPDASLGDVSGDLQGVGRPLAGGGEGGAGFEVEAEDEVMGAEFLDPAGEVGGGGERFEGEDDAGGAASEEAAGLVDVLRAEVDFEFEAVGDEPAVGVPVWDFALERVEVGDVEAVEGKTIADGAGDIEGAGGVGELGDDGLVFIASSTDAANDVSLHEIEDGDDFHGGAFE